MYTRPLYTSMTIQDITRCLRPQTISQDIDSLHGLQTVSTYNTTRADGSNSKVTGSLSGDVDLSTN